MMQEPSIAIVILNWNGFDDTADCLHSLRQTTYNNYTVVLVDNGSANDEGARLKNLFPEIQLICNAKNRGFTGGCNDGMNWAIKENFDYIVTLNNDCLIEKNWLARLAGGLQEAGADFATARIMYYPETDLICSDGDAIFPDGTGYVVNSLKSFQAPGKMQPVFSACGAGAIFSSKCLEAGKIGGDQFFDELFFAYFEDIDLGARLNALSYKGISIPDAVIYHKESKTSGARSFFQLYQSERNRILIELLNFPWPLVALGELCYGLRTLGRNIASWCGMRGQRAARPLPAKNFSPWDVLFKTRWWILKNFPLIWKDRQERKSRGMITYGIWKHFCWDPALLLSLKLD